MHLFLVSLEKIFCLFAAADHTMFIFYLVMTTTVRQASSNNNNMITQKYKHTMLYSSPYRSLFFRAPWNCINKCNSEAQSCAGVEVAYSEHFGLYNCRFFNSKYPRRYGSTPRQKYVLAKKVILTPFILGSWVHFGIGESALRIQTSIKPVTLL